MRSKKLSLVIAIAAGSVLPFASFANDDATKNRAGSGSPTAQDRSASSGASGPGSASPGSGAQVGASAQMDFRQLDANNDGMIDQTEANKSTRLRSDFKSMDKDGDGKISRTEWSSHQARSGGSASTGASGAGGGRPGGTGGSSAGGMGSTR
jgi:hypothetical protein